MDFFGLHIGRKADPSSKTSIGDVSVNMDPQGVMKAYIPEFLYKPPFGYPRKENLPLIRQLAKNPYVFSVIKTLCDEAASTEYDITFKEDVEQTESMENVRKEILEFLDNPNRNKESFQHILRAVVKDVCEVDSGIIVKVFSRKGELVEMFARDGASFLKNPDMYGYLGNRAEYVEPVNINYAMTPESPDWNSTLYQYQLSFKESAAYFQYGTTAMALPVPFGRREIVYMMQNPRSDSIYGLSPISILADVITTLIMGGGYNLDFYMNNNMPEGIISLLNADKDTVMSFRERMDSQIRVKDKVTGFMRKIGFKIPIVNQEVKFTPFQLDPKVMQIIEQQTWFTKIVWSCFGVTADEMGFTEDSNRATGANQAAVYKRKAVRPMLNLIKYHIDKEIIPEWGEEAVKNLEFRWNDYDLEEDLKKHELYKAQVDIGIKTPEMIAEEEGIDVAELKRQKEEVEQKEMEKFQQQNPDQEEEGGDEESFMGKSIVSLKGPGGVKYIKKDENFYGTGKHRYWYKNPKTGKVEASREGPKGPKAAAKPEGGGSGDADALSIESGKLNEEEIIQSASDPKIASRMDAALSKMTMSDEQVMKLAGMMGKLIKPEHASVVMKSSTDYEEGNDTSSLNKKGGEYTLERKQLHAKIAQEYYDLVPKAMPSGAPKAVFMAGLTASGKTESTKDIFDVDKASGGKLMKDKSSGESLIVVNADDIKKMLPEYNGGLSAAVVHRESSEIAANLVEQFTSKGVNVIVDGTLAKKNKAQQQLKRFKDKKYTTQLIHVDVPAQVSMMRSMRRYLVNAEREGGDARFVSPQLIAMTAPEIPKTIEAVKGDIDDFRYIDNRAFRKDMFAA